jgi:two-component system, response regulator PdtaR
MKSDPAKSLRVLIVEDDPQIGMLLAEVLEGMGHEVCSIDATEADAVASALRCGPDMMIVDVWLRDGTGVAAVERICLTGIVPHVFVSADFSRAKGIRPDAVRLQKPFREAGLALAMQSALTAGASA